MKEILENDISLIKESSIKPGTLLTKKNTVVIFDTCALLDIFEYSKNMRDFTIKVMKKLKSKLFLPHQVGKEFYLNKDDRIKKVNDGLNYYVDSCNNIKNSINQNSNTKFVRIVGNSIINRLDSIIMHVNKHIEEFKKFTNDNTFQSQLEILFDGCTGQELADINQLREEFESRVCIGMPPGCSDWKKQNNQTKNNFTSYNNKSGDFLIWTEIISKARKDKCDIIFITSERKEDGRDWFSSIGEKKSIANLELVKEFQRETGQKISICHLEDFLSHASKSLKLNVPKTINNIIKQPVEDDPTIKL